MKIEKLKEKKGIVIIIGVLLICIATTIGVVAYKNSEAKKQIKEEISNITKSYNEFEQIEEREEKLDKLQTMLSQYEDYKKTNDINEEVSNQYDEEIKKMRKYFTDEYDKILTDNTLQNIDKEEDKSKLSTAKEKLESLSKLIKEEEKIVCESQNIKEYDKKITELISSYDKQIKVIEVQEEEKAKAEAEEQARNIEQSTQAQNGNYENNTSNSSQVNSESSTTNSNGYNGNSSNGDRGPNGYPFIPGTNIEYIRWSGDINGNDKIYLGVDEDSWYDSNGKFLYKWSDFWNGY